MSMQDPIADMIIRIKNSQAVTKKEVSMPFSKLKKQVARVLKREGFIVDYREENKNRKCMLIIQLKYYKGNPVISQFNRVSKASLRVYKGYRDLRKMKNSLGMVIVSTSQGVMSDYEARRIKQGGEVLGEIS